MFKQHEEQLFMYLKHNIYFNIFTITSDLPIKIKLQLDYN